MKIAILNGSSAKADSIRGIGVHTNELLRQLKLSINNSQFSITEDIKQADVIHFTKFRPFFRDLPLKKDKNQKWVLTIHDLIPLIYPQIYRPSLKGTINYFINRFLIRNYVDQIITISETSKKDICRFLGVNPNIVNVIYLAPRENFKKNKVTKKYDLPNKFVLYTGDINYNKNIPNLVKACEMANLPLVIAGKQAKEVENMDLTHSETSHLEGVNFRNVIRLGYVSNETLNDLYNLCYCYIQPSFYEGFGLPVLEAIACGSAVVVSKTQALVEILGNGIDYIDPTDPNNMAKGILNPNKNVKLPRKYSWKRTAEETLNVYAKA